MDHTIQNEYPRLIYTFEWWMHWFICKISSNYVIWTSFIYVMLLLLFSCLAVFNSLWPHGLQHARPLCHSATPKICPISYPLLRRCHPAISSFDALFFCLQSFPASRTFPMSQLFTSNDRNTIVSASASVLPTHIQGWFLLNLTGLISLLSKGLSGIFSSTAVRKYQFFGALPSLPSSSHNNVWSLGRS